MKHFEVQVDNSTYNVKINPLNDTTLSNEFTLDNPSYEATKAEYEHCVQRSEKLDNKIYIVLTICAFLFVLISDTLKKVSDFHFPNSKIQLGLIITYAITMTITIALYTYCLINLTKLLKGIGIQRFTPLVILEKDMISANPQSVTRYLCGKYIQCINTNNAILEKRFKNFNRCVNCLFPIIFLSFFLVFICNFIA